MAKGSCDGCGRTIKIAGGIANIWTFSDHQGTGMVLEFEDGTSHLLCYPCIGALPEHPTVEDVERLELVEDEDGRSRYVDEGDDRPSEPIDGEETADR